MTSYVDESEISSLTDAQEIAVTLLSIPSACLSILGSSLIIYLFIKSEHKTPYKRLLLGMSLCDIVISFGVPFQWILVPQATSQRVWAVGNDATCTALGIWWQLSFSAFWYNGMLTFYYLLTIRYGITDKIFSWRVEPFMHVMSVGYPLVTALIGAGMGFYSENELSQGCWVKDYPRNCGTDPTETGETCKSTVIAWIFGGIPVFLMVVFIAVNNTLIYIHVRRTIYRSRRRSFLPTAASDAQTKRVRAVATQAFLYVTAFVLTSVWIVSIKILESMGFDGQHDDQIYFLLVGASVFSPLSGFFNLLIYLRPRYLRTRGDFPRGEPLVGGSESALWRGSGAA